MESLALIEPLLLGLKDRGSDRVVAAVFRSGELDRGHAAAASGYQERQGRKVLQRLLENNLLISATPKGAVRVGFPSSLLVRVASPYGESILSAIIFGVSFFDRKY